MSLGTAPIGADGSFTFIDVPAGEYQIRVATGDVRNGDGEIGRAAVAVEGVDVENVRLLTTAGWSAVGRVVTEDGSPPPFRSTDMRVASQLIDDVRAGSAGVGEVLEDWTFSVRAILGPARITATVPDGWMVRTIRREGRDISETPIDLKSGAQLADIEVVVTNRVTAVSGQLLDTRGAPQVDGTVIVYADEAAKWGVGSRFVRATRPDQEGRWEVRGLPAGDYLAVAVDYVEENSWNDPQYLDALRTHAQGFSLLDGAAQTLSLRMIIL